MLGLIGIICKERMIFKMLRGTEFYQRQIGKVIIMVNSKVIDILSEIIIKKVVLTTQATQERWALSQLMQLLWDLEGETYQATHSPTEITHTKTTR